MTFYAYHYMVVVQDVELFIEKEQQDAENALGYCLKIL